ncbi:MAG: zinc ribbon domain-containing protein [Thermodesulfobacteriota bacterium]|nr:zinc ribbon domain-containing protein [Thermodesulfobacteriota bacterium]
MKNKIIFLALFVFIGFHCCGCVPLWLAGGAAAGAAGTHIYKEKYRECPYCKKNIKKDATVCPYCQKEVKPIEEE